MHRSQKQIALLLAGRLLLSLLLSVSFAFPAEVEEQKLDVAGDAGVDEDACGDTFAALMDNNQGTVPTNMLSLQAGCPNTFIMNFTRVAFPWFIAYFMHSV